MFIQRWRLIGLVTLCFLVGAVSGTVYESVASGDPAKRRGRLSDMVSKLDLSEAQKTQLDTVLNEGRKCMVGLNKTYRAEFGKVRDTMRSHIKSILRADQRVEFDKMLAEQARRREANRARWQNNGIEKRTE